MKTTVFELCDLGEGVPAELEAHDEEPQGKRETHGADGNARCQTGADKSERRLSAPAVEGSRDVVLHVGFRAGRNVVGGRFAVGNRIHDYMLAGFVLPRRAGPKG